MALLVTCVLNFSARINRPPLSLARLVRNLKKEGNASKLAVCVGTVTNDLRFSSILVIVFDSFIAGGKLAYVYS